MTKATSKKKAWCTSIALIPIIIAAVCVFSNCTFSSKTSEDANIVKEEPQPAPVVNPPQPTFHTIGDRVVYETVDESAEFPGGMSALNKFLSETIVYPVIAQENGIQGRVTVQFIINKDGTIIDANIARGIDPSLDKEALRVTNLMPKWIPGKVKGEAVASKFTLPVRFNLQ